MKNINYIKHFKNIKNISNIKKNRLAFKKRNNEKLLKNRGYRDFIAKVKSKKQNDDDFLEQMELLYFNSLA
ncbi:hypothetical protein [Helicobacter pylori]|uniref:hypothetical protein n=1 Tax=Helicobacter pylori TaxID=210 RepID=UPI00026B4513|nr:hypothetical protein [Helicobacter pylori]EJC34988.1 hypothetical protein HPHPP25C_0316 [Helicobacter pylori Hp P-25c]EJC38772.1 hypothetical protein HPHPP25D_0452 [Helicobacter pylori Hp P-25d]